MRIRLLLGALLAFGSAAPAAVAAPAPVRAAVPGSVSIVPSFASALAPGPARFSPVSDFGFPLTPVPELAVSVIPVAAVSLQPSFVAPVPSLRLEPSQDVSRPRQVVASLHDLGKLVSAAEAVFDGATGKAALKDAEPAALPLPLGAKSVSVVRLNSPLEASAFIPRNANTAHFIAKLAAKWSEIGWLDLRVYADEKGGSFRALDLSGRPELAENLPDVQPHEAASIRKIQLHSKDLQLMILEEGKNPDLIVDGVVTEMKSLSRKGERALKKYLGTANEQVLDHATRHLLAPGAVAIDLTSRDVVPVAKFLSVINDYARTSVPLGLVRVSVYAGKERQVFIRGGDGLFDLQDSSRLLMADAKTYAPLAKTAARFLVPNVLGLAPVLDPKVIVREITEPAARLHAAGVEATVPVYGSARILPPDVARAKLGALVNKYGNKSKRPEERRLVYAARQAVEMSKYYEIARKFGRIVAENGGGKVALVTGGGPGIMEAANRGAFEADGPSVGYNIILDNEQGLNKYVTRGLNYEFAYFDSRNIALSHGAMGAVVFPGGFGTMYELAQILTLLQTRKMRRVPVVLIGKKSFWEKIIDFNEFERRGLISPGDLSLFRFADTAEGAWREIVPISVAR